MLKNISCPEEDVKYTILYFILIIMNYAPYEFDVFSVKNLDVECICEFDNREYYQE